METHGFGFEGFAKIKSEMNVDNSVKIPTPVNKKSIEFFEDVILCLSRDDAVLCLKVRARTAKMIKKNKSKDMNQRWD